MYIFEDEIHLEFMENLFNDLQKKYRLLDPKIIEQIQMELGGFYFLQANFVFKYNCLKDRTDNIYNRPQ